MYTRKAAHRITTRNRGHSPGQLEKTGVVVMRFANKRPLIAKALSDRIAALAHRCRRNGAGII